MAPLSSSEGTSEDTQQLLSSLQDRLEKLTVLRQEQERHQRQQQHMQQQLLPQQQQQQQQHNFGTFRSAPQPLLSTTQVAPHTSLRLPSHSPPTPPTMPVSFAAPNAAASAVQSSSSLATPQLPSSPTGARRDDPSRLRPSWRVSTDCSVYHLDCTVHGYSYAPYPFDATGRFGIQHSYEELKARAGGGGGGGAAAGAAGVVSGELPEAWQRVLVADEHGFSGSGPRIPESGAATDDTQTAAPSYEACVAAARSETFEQQLASILPRGDAPGSGPGSGPGGGGFGSGPRRQLRRTSFGMIAFAISDASYASDMTDDVYAMAHGVAGFGGSFFLVALDGFTVESVCRRGVETHPMVAGPEVAGGAGAGGAAAGGGGGAATAVPTRRSLLRAPHQQHQQHQQHQHWRTGGRSLLVSEREKKLKSTVQNTKFAVAKALVDAGENFLFFEMVSCLPSFPFLPSFLPSFLPFPFNYDPTTEWSPSESASHAQSIL